MSVEWAIERQAQDDRFRALLPKEDWDTLPCDVQRRFSKALGPGQSVTYIGKITAFRRNRWGWALAQALRLAGGPLPICPELGMASVVSVTEDAAGAGQNWTRLYANKTGFPQVIHSAKRFDGPSGLTEHIGAGISMALGLSVENGALVFKSKGFYCGRLRLPRWMAPGAVEVRHKNLGFGRFEFSLALRHPLLGELLYQAAEYREERL